MIRRDVARWPQLPMWRRRVYKVTGVGAATALATVYAAAPTATVSTLGAVAVYGGGRGAVRARRLWRMRRFRRVYVKPTLSALRPALGDAPLRLDIDPCLGNLVARLAKPTSPAEREVRAWYGHRVEPVVRWLPERVWKFEAWCRGKVEPVARQFRRDVDDKGPRIQLSLSVPYLTAEQRQYVSSVVGAKIPAGDMIETWDQVGPKVVATWTVRRRPPNSVGYADLDARMPNLAEDQFFIGLGVGGKAVTISLSDDSPHIAVSASTGAGKSVLAQAVGLQALARGGQVVILDRKGSHRWALGLPGVIYCRTVAQMHAELVRLAEVANLRNDLAFDDPDRDIGPRILLICEELNATFDMLRDYWDETRDRGEPKKSPAVKGLKDLLFMGRSAKVNVIGVAQMLTARAIGGPEARECFAVRCLARYSANAWKMLVPEAAMPRVSRTLGRWQIVVGGAATETQVCFLEPAEARLFVAKHAGVTTGTHTPLMGADQEMYQLLRHETAPEADPMGVLVSLRDAVETGIMPWKYGAARQRLARARKAGRDVPEPRRRDGTTDLYRTGDLVAWSEAELGIGTVTE